MCFHNALDLQLTRSVHRPGDDQGGHRRAQAGEHRGGRLLADAAAGEGRDEDKKQGQNPAVLEHGQELDRETFKKVDVLP